MKFPLSYHQQRIWFIDQFENGTLYPSGPTYHNIPFISRITGPVNLEVLASSIKAFYSTEEILKGKVITEEGNAWLIPQKETAFDLEIFEPEGKPIPQVLEQIIQISQRPFDLETDLLFRASWFQIDTNQGFLLLCSHHLVVDKYSMSLIHNEIWNKYETLMEGLPILTQAKSLSYFDFSNWQLTLPEEVLENLLFYWKGKLRFPLFPLVIHTDFPRARIHTYTEGHFNIEIPDLLHEQLHGLASKQNIAPSILLRATFLVLLARFSGQTDLLTGVSHSNRLQPGTERIIGPMANLLVIRSLVDSEQSFLELISQLSKSLEDAEENHVLPFDKLVQELKPPKDMSRTALFDILFQYEEVPDTLFLEGNLKIEEIPTNLGLGKYDLNLLILDKAGSYSGILTYNRDHHQQETIHAMMDHYLYMLQGIVDNPNEKVGQIPIRPAFSGQLVAPPSFPTEATLGNLYSQKAHSQPESICLLWESTSLTYGFVEAESNRLAHFLLQNLKGSEPGIFGILSHRCEWMVIGILGILKAGGTYLPIDPAYPNERVKYMLNDSGTEFLLTWNQYNTRFDNWKGKPLFFEQYMADREQYPSQVPDLNISSSHPAYIIYTSGTTGKPKGCLVTHRNVSSLICNDQLPFEFSSEDTWTLAHSYCFDFSVWEIFGALLLGGKLAIPKEAEVKDIRLFHQFVKEHKVSVLNTTPAAFNHFSETELQNPGKFLSTHLRYVIFGGDRLAPEKLTSWIDRYSLDQIHLINMYGITETTVHVSYYRLSETDIRSSQPVSVIGKALPGVEIKVLDTYLQDLPKGVKGEMFVGGNGVSLGYLNRYSLTDERFIELPECQGLYYRTGDLGRRLVCGNIEYLGRIDGQVKIRGFRIELEEIDQFLKNQPEVEDNLTLAAADQDSGKNLVSYYIGGITSTELILRMKNTLPSYMIPAFFVPVDQFKLTSNGKIDKDALPDYRDRNNSNENEYLAPGSTAEKILEEIWTEVLGRQRVGLNDNFFDLGGHSLTATRMISRVYKQTGTELFLRDVFSMPTIRELAYFLAPKPQTSYQAIPKLASKEAYDLSHAQRRLWILNQLGEDKGAYNMTGTFLLKGDLDKTRIRKALQILVLRHESLRTIFPLSKGKPKQVILPKITEVLSERDFTDSADIQEEVNQFLAEESIFEFDLEKGPLFRVSLLIKGEKHFLLVINVHHIICDGWSSEILLKEIMNNYNLGEDKVEPLTIQYKEYAAWQLYRLEKGGMVEAADYWHHKLSGELPVLQLSTDYPRAKEKTHQGAMCSFPLGVDFKKGLTNLCHKVQISEFMAYLSLVRFLLFKYSNQRDFIIGVPVAGRNHPDLEDQIGFFINTLALREEVNEQEPVLELLKQGKMTVTEALHFQDYPFDLLVDELAPARDLGRSPLFDIMVNLPMVEDINFSLADLQITPYEVPVLRSKVDLSFNFVEKDGLPMLSILFDTTLFQSATIDRMAQHFKYLAHTIFQSPEQPLKEFELITETEKNKWKQWANGQEYDLPFTKSIYDKFLQSESLTTRKTALIFGEENWSYQKLADQINQLADQLIFTGLKKGDKVGLLLEKSPLLPVAMLAVLKCGGVFINLDPGFPEKRLNWQVSDSEISVLLKDSATAHLLNDFQGKSIVVDLSKTGGNIPTEIETKTNFSNHDPAYVFYTSGSTGNPKGVIASHRNVLNYLYYLESEVGLDSSARVMQIAATTFDALIRDLLCPLLVGATVVIPTKEEKENSFAILRAIERSRVDHILSIVPSYLSKLLDSASAMKFNYPGVKVILSSGEVLRPDLAKQVFELFGKGLKLGNQYGPTECTMTSTLYWLDPNYEDQTNIPVGKPNPNVRVYILRNGSMTPPGMEGEIFIAGLGLSSGYKGNEALTDIKFVRDPFFEGSKMYATGDFGMWSSDGNLVYKGRKDQQIKIGGIRIEPEEIIKHLIEVEGVAKAIVVKRKLNNETEVLAGYWISDTSYPTIGSKEIRKALMEKLPTFMIPSHFIKMKRFPYLPNGKVNYRGLPDLTTIPSQEETSFIAPSGEIEMAIASLWEEVLQTKSFGIYDNFFDLGGNSLLALQISLGLYKELQVEVNLRELFSYSTIAELSALIPEKWKEEYKPISQIPPNDNYKLSHAQSRLWFIEEMKPGLTVYNMEASWQIDGELDTRLVCKAFQLLVDRHEILRTTFDLFDGEIRQEVHPQKTMDFEEMDLTNMSNSNDFADTLQQKILDKAFDFKKGPLIRALLLKTDHQSFRLILVIHHIIFDYLSGIILSKELWELYRQGPGMTAGSLPSLFLQYKDFAHWQFDFYDKEEKTGEYWLRKMAKLPDPLELPADRPRPSFKTYPGNRITFALPDKLMDQLSALARDEGASSFMAITATIQALFFRYTQQEDFILGVSVGGRNHPDLQEQVGNYINMVPLRGHFKGESNFRKILRLSKTNLTEALSHQAYPFDKLVNKLPLERDTSRHPLFDVLLVSHNAVEQQAFPPGLECSLLAPIKRTSKFDLTFFFGDLLENGAYTIEYNTDLFDLDRIQRLNDHLITLLSQIVDNPDKEISKLNYVTQEEFKLIQTAGDHLQVSFSEKETISSIFETIASQFSNRPALNFHNEEWDYRHLNDAANNLARLLLSHDVEPGALVGILLSQSMEMVVSILAILKTGAAYVPIDPDYPEERIKFIISDSGIKYLISDLDLTWRKQFDIEVIIPQVHEQTIEPNANIEASIHAEAPAYLIYTSGSTGSPKGVLVTHRNVVRLLYTETSPFDFSERDVWTLFHSYCFDFSVWEIFGALLFGGKLVIVPKAIVQDPPSFCQLIQDQKVTVLNQTPGYFYNFLGIAGILVEKPFSLRYIIFGGETLSGQKIRAFKQQHPKIELVNMYGITETTVHVTCKFLNLKDLDSPYSLIGKPIPTLKIHLLDTSLQPVGIGLPGEICVEGEGLALGYHNREEETKERFITMNGTSKQKIYKSGDLAMWLPNGELAYLGRSDNQVKVRGFRIELGEIEHCLESHELVGRCIAVVIEGQNGHASICAYLVMETQISLDEIRQWAIERLPSHMVPVYFSSIFQVPLNRNGKVDKKSLPNPILEISGRAVENGRPHTEEESVLFQAWKEVLGLDTLNINDNFFHLGGDSIQSIQMIARIREKNWRGKIKDLFEAPTIADFAKKIDPIQVRANQEKVQGKINISPIQHWFFEQQFINPNHWNQSIVLFREEGIQLQLLEKAMGKLLRHHDMLNLRIRKRAQKYPVESFIPADPDYNFGLSFHDLRLVNDFDSAVIPILDEAQKILNIESGPLINTVLIKSSQGDHLMITIHHLVVDTFSWRIILDDLSKAYTALDQGEEVLLPLKSHSFQAWSQSLEAFLKLPEWKSVRKYWNSLDLNSAAVFPGRKRSGNGRQFTLLTWELSFEETKYVTGNIHKAYNTNINDVLLSALAMAYNELSGTNELVVDLEGHGREEVQGLPDIGRTVGWFTSKFPVRIIWNKNMELGYGLKMTKESLRNLPMNGLGFGMFRYLEKTDIEASQQSYSDPDIRFNYLGQSDADLDRSIFEWSHLPPGTMISEENERTHALEISGLVKSGQMRFHFVFDPEYLDQKIIFEFGNLFIISIKKLIHHCQNRSSTQATPSDFQDADLSLEELENIQESLEGLLSPDEK
jgi:amino acid adenylation domain-containing protein/non-ribosomal peptide synthase protein (TIGR01720 family)